MRVAFNQPLCTKTSRVQKTSAYSVGNLSIEKNPNFSLSDDNVRVIISSQQLNPGLSMVPNAEYTQIQSRREPAVPFISSSTLLLSRPLAKL